MVDRTDSPLLDSFFDSSNIVRYFYIQWDRSNWSVVNRMSEEEVVAFNKDLKLTTIPLLRPPLPPLSSSTRLLLFHQHPHTNWLI